MCKCSFCGSDVEALRIVNLDLRICPKCYSIYFPCNQTFAFYGGLSDKTRELWLEDLKKRNVQDPPCENPKCIDHGEPLVKGKLAIDRETTFAVVAGYQGSTAGERRETPLLLYSLD